MSRYIMALDQGTTGSRCIIFDRQGTPVSIAQREISQFYPADGWVEHDPDEIWRSQTDVAREAVHKANLSFRDITAVGITNQRETAIVWDRDTGEPVYNAIVWQCRRTTEICDLLKADGHEKLVQTKTGLPIDPYFSATKIRWILDNVDGAYKKAEDGRLIFGTVETWLIWKLTAGRVHITDYSNASRTMLFNIHSLEWDDELLKLFGVPRAMLPEVRPSSEVYGETDAEIFGLPLPIAGAAGDQQSSLFGQGCLTAGEAKNTYGTGCFLLMNTGDTPVASGNGLLTTIAWGLPSWTYHREHTLGDIPTGTHPRGHTLRSIPSGAGRQTGGQVSDGVTYALEGSVFIAGAAIQWLRDEMKLIEEAPDSEWMASKVSDSQGVYMIPAFVGLGAPYWNPHARGMILGLTRATNKNHIIRAALESLAYQSYDLLMAMEKDAGIPLRELRVDGGASANDLLIQFQTDILRVPVLRPKCIEITAFGAACLAGLATGYWASPDEIFGNLNADTRFEPYMDMEKRDELLAGWSRAIDIALYSARNGEQ